jgi:hypothetical protein
MTRALGEFRLEAGVYRLGQFSPVSIRDQVVRANYLVEHLAHTTELATSTRILVIGGGAAGLTAAAAASRLGVRDVTLAERAGTVMPLQSRSVSRWLDPVQYDWPAAHWADEAWPVDETPRRFTAVSIPFPKLTAALAEDWALEFQNRTAGILGRGVTALFDTEASLWRRATGGGLEVDLHNLKTGATAVAACDLLILAAGFGVEHSAVPDTTSATDFWGLDFWSTDKFETVDMGIAAAKHGVLVSGAGDGALQDFVRLATGLRSVRDLLEAVWSSTPDSTPWKDQFSALWHWEDNAGRARNFVPSPLAECEVLRRLHRRHIEAVDALASSPEWATVLQWLDTATTGRRLGAVELAFKCDHFSWCYPLNRTGALITARYLKDRGHDVLRFETALKSTAPRSHACGPSCWGQTHEAHLAQGVTCAHSEADIRTWPAANTLTEHVDGLAIRHGIDPLVFGARTFARMSPQVVPFHLP